MKLARFEDNYGREVYVNADRVNFIVKYDDKLTQVDFGGDKDSRLFVTMPVSSVASTLANAGKV